MPPHPDAVRLSRKGDQFHYVWAARQALQLLNPRTRLRELWVERAAGEPSAGSEIIDIAEYFGDDAEVDEVVVSQLKYSTTRMKDPVEAFELKATFQKFATLEKGGSTTYAVPPTATVRYQVVLNRPVSQSLLDGVDALRSGVSARPTRTSALLAGYLEMGEDSARVFAGKLSFVVEPHRVEDHRARLRVSMSALSGSAQSNSASVLVEAIARRADGEIDEPIRPSDVAQAFGATIEQLTPAPPAFESNDRAFRRDVYDALAHEIISDERPLIIAADGGAGKSTFATQLPAILGDRAVVIVYDCFGRGNYRGAFSRHRHADGLVQMASELAAQGLSRVLVPEHGSDAVMLLRSFRERLQAAGSSLAAEAHPRRLVLLVDAADNAAMAADDNAEEGAFVRDLLTLGNIPNVHIALTSRPYRVHMLNPPHTTRQTSFPVFDEEETRRHLEARYGPVTHGEALEFHARTSGNPRAQEAAFAEQSLASCLGMLTGIAATGGDAVGHLLSDRLGRILDEGLINKPVLENLARLLSALPPPIPLATLTRLTGLSSDAIRSFASDLRRGLLVSDGAAQFLDEPTETFFRERYPLTGEGAAAVVNALAEQAHDDAYAALTLPQLLWRAGRFDALLELATSITDSVPTASEVEGQFIVAQRVQFGLRAAIRLERYPAVVALALRAGANAAGSERRHTLLRDEADLAGDFLQWSVLDEICAARLLPSDWPGASATAEALMLTANATRQGQARARARAGEESLRSRLRAGGRPPRREDVYRSMSDLVLSSALFDGAAQATQKLRLKSTDAQLAVYRRVAAVLLSRRNVSLVDELGRNSLDAGVSLALAAEQQRLGLPLSRGQARRALKLIAGVAADFDHSDHAEQELADATLRGAAWIVAAATRHQLISARNARKVLNTYLPSAVRSDVGDFRGREHRGLLFALALHERLADGALGLEHLIPEQDEEQARLGLDHERQEHALQLATVLPWLHVWAARALGEPSVSEILPLLNKYPLRPAWKNSDFLLRRIAGPLSAQFARDIDTPAIEQAFTAILSGAHEHSGMYVTLDMVGSLYGERRFEVAAYTCLGKLSQLTLATAQAAEDTAHELVMIARAAYPYDPKEARAYFDEAVRVSTRVGYDVRFRWAALLELASSARGAERARELAAHLADTAVRVADHSDGEMDERGLIRAVRQLGDHDALAVLSRWRDSGFGSFPHMLSYLIDEIDGVFATQPLYALALSPFSDQVSISSQLRRLAEQGALKPKTFNRARRLAWRLGQELNPTLLGEALTHRYGVPPVHPPLLPTFTRRSSHLGNDVLDSSVRKKDRARRKLARLDLTSRQGMRSAARVLRRLRRSDSSVLLYDAVGLLAVSARAEAIDAFVESGAFTEHETYEFLALVSASPPISKALTAAVRRLASSYVAENGTELVTGYSALPRLTHLSTILTRPRSEVLFTSLAHADPSVITADSNACYRLASVVATVMEPGEAAETLHEALLALEVDLGGAPFDPTGLILPEADGMAGAVAGLLWTAMADPRSAIRWRAMHAHRFLTEEQAPGFLEAVAALPVRPEGFTAETLPLYDMHAAESLLCSFERALIEVPAVRERLLAMATSMAERYPDHFRIQDLASRVTGEQRLALRAPRHLDADEVPRAPKPFEAGAPAPEFRVYMDTDEYWLAPLSEAFAVEHKRTLNALSDLVLDEWGWRGREEIEVDPRVTAGALTQEQVFSRKGDDPTADSLEHYLSYHAMMTVAGRVARTDAPVHRLGYTTSSFAEWYARFDLARADRRWISDARRPLPPGVHTSAPRREDNWRWNVDADTFISTLFPPDGTITGWLYARNSGYAAEETLSVRSALVPPDGAAALVRALQTAPSLNRYRLPLADRRGQRLHPTHPLRGWVADDSHEMGADWRDPFAGELIYPPAAPASWVIDALGLTGDAESCGWTSDTQPSVRLHASTWADMAAGRTRSGFHGHRLLLTREALDALVSVTGSSVVVEIRIGRDTGDRSYRPDNDKEHLDDYVRYLRYDTTEGWRDYLGRSCAG